MSQREFKVLLVNPGKLFSQDNNIPLSLLYVSKPLVANGFTVRILDCNVENYKKVNYKEYGCIGLTAMSGGQVAQILTVAKYIKNQSPNAKIIWGGPHASAVPSTVIESDLVDIVIKGEGEIALLKVIQRLEKNEELDGICGLAYKKDGNIINTPYTQPINLNEIGDLPYELIDMGKYPNIYDKFDYISSKGCPHQCTFCSDAANYKQSWRHKSPKVVIGEMEYIIEKFNPQRFTIQDANFFVSTKRVLEICKIIIRKGWKKKFYAFIRCDYLVKYDEDFLSLLYKAGFTELAFGAESGDNRLLDYIKKQQKVEHILEAVRKLERCGIKPIISLMAGLPTETEKELNSTLDLYDGIMKIHPDAMVNGIFIFTPFPGSDLADLVEKEYGYQPPKSLEEWSNWRFSDKNYIPWANKTMRNKYEAICILSRYLFVSKLLNSWSFNQIKVRCGSSSLLAVCIIVFNSFFGLFAKFRWRARFFSFFYEMKIWFKVYEQFKGWG